VFFSQFQWEDGRSELSSLAIFFWEVGACFLGLGFILVSALFTSCFSEPLIGSADHKLNHKFVSQFEYLKVDPSSTVVGTIAYVQDVYSLVLVPACSHPCDLPCII